jgi:hypothetical protein
MYRRNVVCLHLQGEVECLTPTVKALQSSAMSGTMQHHTPEDLSPQLHFYKNLQTQKIYTVWTSGLTVYSVADGTHCLHLQGVRRWKPVWSSRTLPSTYQTTICQSDMNICQMVLNVHKERDMHRHDNTQTFHSLWNVADQKFQVLIPFAYKSMYCIKYVLF